MEKLMEILGELRPDVDFENEDALITDGILESFDIVFLLEKIKEVFGIEIQPEQLIPENFDSASAMMALIEKLQNN